MSDDLLQRFFDTTEDLGIILLDPGGRVRRWNRAAERMFGYTADEMEGAPGGLIFVPPDRRAGVPEAELRTAAEQGRAEDERWHLRKDGSRFWGSGVVVALRRGDEIVGYAKVLRDFTERRRLEEATRGAEKLESLGVLAAGMAHDFNNVLTTIIGNVGLARGSLSSGAADPELEELLREVERAGQRAAEQVRQLLNYAGKARQIVRPVDVCRLAGDALAIVRGSVPSHVELRLDVPDRCPPVRADVAQLQQLLLSLIHNAAEAIGAGPGRVTVRMRLRDDTAAARRHVEIQVHDTGQGMDAETLRRIFDPFFTTKFLGRGLGLAAALGIARSHGGEIMAESTPGHGSTFTVRLPAGEAEAAGHTLSDVVSDAARGEGMALVVDDEAGIRSLVQRMLEPLGYTVLLAEDGRQALRIFERVGPELVLVLMDVAMPVLGGAETAAAMQARRPDLPIIVMSALADDDALRRLAGVRVAGFVPKPFSPGQLAHALAVARRLNPR